MLKRTFQLTDWLAILLGLVFLVVWAFPFYWMFVSSLMPLSEVLSGTFSFYPKNISWQNYIDVLSGYPMLRWFINSCVITFTATIFSILTGSMMGYALARLSFPGRKVLFLILLSSLMIPVEMYVIPMLIAFLKIGWGNSYQAMILPLMPNVFSVYIFRQFFLTLPLSVEESGRMDGASTLSIFWQLVLPLAQSAMIASAIILFNLNWNNFLWPLLVALSDDMKTLTVGIADLAPTVGAKSQLQSFGVGMAGVTLVTIPAAFFFIILQRYFVAGIKTFGQKG